MQTPYCSPEKGAALPFPSRDLTSQLKIPTHLVLFTLHACWPYFPLLHLCLGDSEQVLVGTSDHSFVKAAALTCISSSPRDDRHVTRLVLLFLSMEHPTLWAGLCLRRAVQTAGPTAWRHQLWGRWVEDRMQRFSCRDVYDGEETEKSRCLRVPGQVWQSWSL